MLHEASPELDSEQAGTSAHHKRLQLVDEMQSSPRLGSPRPQAQQSSSTVGMRGSLQL